MIQVHFLDVGQGTMVVTVFDDDTTMVYDCNITEHNKTRVLGYLRTIMPKRQIDLFVNSHRDADHMSGIKELHSIYPIRHLWDSGLPGNADAPEYTSYMNIRRIVPCETVKGPSYWTEKPSVKVLSGLVRERNPNNQSVVIKITNGASVLLTGDTDGRIWKDFLAPAFREELASHILLASHHGSRTFFETYEGYGDYVGHIHYINPLCVIISTGLNPHGHPDKRALEYYDNYSRGLSDGTTILRTDQNGNIRVYLNDNRSIRVEADRA